MSIISKTVFALLLIYGSLTIGWFFRVRNWCSEKRSAPLMRGAILCLEPIICCFAFWILDLSNLRILTLPVVGALIVTLTFIPAYILARSLRLDRKRKGSYILGALFSNGGYLGAPLCFLLLGEEAFALAWLYIIFFGPYFFTVGLSLAAQYGYPPSSILPRKRGGSRWWYLGRILKNFFTDKIRILPLLGIGVGLALNLAHYPRPGIFAGANGVLVPLAIFLYMFAIGLGLRLGRIKKFFREIGSVSLIKFVYAPLVGIGLGFLFGYQHILGGLPLKVVFIQAIMPTAIWTVIAANLYGLDKDLSNAIWITTTLFLLPLVPLIVYVIRII